ncbi:MAG: hypothetical protein WAT71_15650 [Ignavibacteria bacterium]
MSIDQTVCQCEEKNITDELVTDVSKMSCCDNKVHEINNSNTLVKNNTTYSNLISFQQVISILPQNEISLPFTDHLVYLNYHKPPSDIPILISSFLI